ncbi:hypothetical protein WOLCODRAFT_139005 [Wolfiporia cocos MD-104 SS10]|uniref:Chromo domain-containing protein n=1 Tax=Wolfiporia cocos (strain MD-104) TaxID=742152 RepID=A0A2H3JZV6_WOLCO|nr:hypothetical protein WOLCODRAFT_139005 [Wolfiporia cocos MD-104 SS10]
MARNAVAALDSDSDVDMERSSRTQKASNSKASTKNHSRTEDEDVEEDVQGSEAGEEEYEIERILDAKRGTFPDGRMGYLVKWRNYGEEHNSWVDEQDAGNAQDLIDEYWNSQKKKGGRKSTSSASKPPAAKGRQSEPSKEESPELDDIRPKKRGRPSRSIKKAEEQDEEQEQLVRESKKIKTTKSKLSKSNDMDDSDVELIDMKTKYAGAATWEHLVDHIDTVERGDDDELYVYFTLRKNKARAKETTTVCKDKMPRKLLDFYEKNLRWRTVEEDDMDQD